MTSNYIDIPIKIYDDNYKWFSEKNGEICDDEIIGNLDELRSYVNSSKTINFGITPLLCINKDTRTCWLSLKISQMLFASKS
jgi:hypothetical protein